MTSTQRELFRLALLRVMESNPTQRGLGLQALQLSIGAFGFSMPGLDQLKAELAYLEDKRFVIIVGHAISPENKTWRITADGRADLAPHG